MDYKGRYVDHRALAAKCRARVDVYNMAGSDWLAKHELDCASAINDLISRLEAAEVGCAALDEARENANEACAKWEGMYRMALERAEKAEITDPAGRADAGEAPVPYTPETGRCPGAAPRRRRTAPG